ncbi:hypothetical protein [Hansschlegelia sp. KR7-227]|uniref:hypothetical protein n=1 Tax=Hansschlegelia sp. KR7-227 TaxID=3400914 RepID=UPI003C049C59
MTEAQGGGSTHIDVVCPFCGLGCDDVSLKIDGLAVEAGEGACGRAAALFRRSQASNPAPRVGGSDASLDEAIAAAADLLAGARAPFHAGLGTDVDGVRAVIKLAGKVGGGVDHYASAGLFRNLSTAQRKGWVATTLAEVRNRCDLLVVVGPDPSESFHRLYDRVTPAKGRFVEGVRRVVFLGGEPTAEAKTQLAGAKVETISVPEGGLVDCLSRLHALVAGTPAASGDPDIGPLATSLKAAKYGVLAWSAASLGSDGDLVVERAAAVVDALNVETRAACLPLAGRDNLIGANQTFLWNVGFPLRTAFSGGVASHDQTLNATEAALAEADVLVWTSSFRPELPPESDARLIAIAHPATKFEREPDVFIPVGQPGLDHAGLAFRTDTVVAIPLGKHRDSGLPSVADVLKRILEQHR